MNVVHKPARPAPGDVAAFLAWEDAQEGRHEYDGTGIVPMTGGSLAHQLLILELAASIRARLDRTRFVVAPEMRLRAGAAVRYPDLLIAAAPLPLDTRTLTDALVTIEVLSDETARIDRTDKLADYAALPGLCRYVLLDQRHPAATVHARTAAGQPLSPVATLGPGDLLPLPEAGVHIALDELYAALR